jgi:phosphoribosyl 1,2-cyclic phosphodiesterase
MAARFAVLASGSSGNASFLQADGFGVLLDVGLGPRELAGRFASAGFTWQQVNAVLLTHTHGDHWKERTFAHLVQRKLPLYCHRGHHDVLTRYSQNFNLLCERGLVRDYDPEQELTLAPGLTCRPLPVRHDAGPTFGFRLSGSPDLFGPSWTLGYVADLGCWTADLVKALVGADVLAVEFNHDERMERSSGRPAHLIARVLGDHGHLSNAQAADLLRAVLRHSEPGGLRHVVQLHLSRHCNKPALALTAAQRVLAEQVGVEVHTAAQDRVGPVLRLDLLARERRSAPRVNAASA